MSSIELFIILRCVNFVSKAREVIKELYEEELNDINLIKTI